MRPTRTETMLRLSAGLLWAAAAGVIAVAVWVPVDRPPADAVAPVRPATTTAVASAVTFDDVLDVRLRRPLVDPPPALPGAATPVVVAPPPPAVRLAGIIAEPGHSVAVLVGPTGEAVPCAVGKSVGGAEVVAIAPTAVTVRVGGQLRTLTLPPPGR